jgi:membrane protease YdiL (CAAX protease family)
MTMLDHLFVLLFVVIHPVAGFIGFRRLMRRVDAGESVNRSNEYFQTAIWQWVLFGIGAAVWSLSSRPLSAIGFSFELNLSFALGVAVVMVSVGLLLLQIRYIKSADKAAVDKMFDQLGFVQTMVPRNGNELAKFYGVSLTAGIVEEVLWRGGLIGYLSLLVPFWAAVILSTLGFALAHSYQGIAHLPGVLFIGTILAATYVISGSIWLPIILHILIDVLQGYGMHELFRRKTAPAA